jgi:hypothetical protein
MRTARRVAALSATIIAILLVSAAASARTPAVSESRSPTLSTVNQGQGDEHGAAEVNRPVSDGTTSAGAPEVKSGPLPYSAPAAGVDVVKSGQLPYTAPNAAVPEAQRAGSGDIVCPGKDPCGP